MLKDAGIKIEEKPSANYQFMTMNSNREFFNIRENTKGYIYINGLK